MESYSVKNGDTSFRFSHNMVEMKHQSNSNSLASNETNIFPLKPPFTCLILSPRLFVYKYILATKRSDTQGRCNDGDGVVIETSHHATLDS